MAKSIVKVITFSYGCEVMTILRRWLRMGSSELHENSGLVPEMKAETRNDKGIREATMEVAKCWKVECK